MNKKYGFHGWKEFESNRQLLLQQYELAKTRTQSRPVQTGHGITGEAEIRQWLTEFLPSKYGVTSGFIIPDIITTEKYQLYHHDIIIFDKFNAPILWENSSKDDSETGKERAIPAKYVHTVFEVKSQFNHTSTKETIDKLKKLSSFSKDLPDNFNSGIIFFELDINLNNRISLLRNLLPVDNILGYWGGIILQCSANKEMSGLFTVKPRLQTEQIPERSIPLAKDVDTLDIYLDDNGDPVIGPQERLKLMAFDKWHFIKEYGPLIHGKNHSIELSWSYNSFAQFCTDLLLRLEGKNPGLSEKRIHETTLQRSANRVGSPPQNKIISFIISTSNSCLKCNLTSLNPDKLFDNLYINNMIATIIII